MKINIDFDGKNQQSLITYFLDEFKTDRDYVVAISILETFCADFNLEPEFEPEDLKEIMAKVEEKQVSEFKVIISEDDIEVDF
jgi:hypothetical protein